MHNMNGNEHELPYTRPTHVSFVIRCATCTRMKKDETADQAKKKLFANIEKLQLLMPAARMDIHRKCIIFILYLPRMNHEYTKNTIYSTT